MAATGATWKGEMKMAIAAPVEKLWEVSSDFGGIYKLFPIGSSVTSEITEGEPQAIGCLRSVITPEAMANERLLEMDHKEHLIKYAIEKNTLGLDGYVATFQLFPHGSDETLVNWSFEMPALDGRTEEDIAAMMIPLYNALLKRLEALVLTP